MGSELNHVLIGLGSCATYALSCARAHRLVKVIPSVANGSAWCCTAFSPESLSNLAQYNLATCLGQPHTDLRNAPSQSGAWSLLTLHDNRARLTLARMSSDRTSSFSLVIVPWPSFGVELSGTQPGNTPCTTSHCRYYKAQHPCSCWESTIQKSAVVLCIACLSGQTSPGFEDTNVQQDHKQDGLLLEIHNRSQPTALGSAHHGHLKELQAEFK